MADLTISTPLADELRAIAERENQTVEELLKLLISQYEFLVAEDEDDAGWEEANAVLRERYARLRGGSEADEVIIGGEETVARLRSSTAKFRDLLDENPT